MSCVIYPPLNLRAVAVSHTILLYILQFDLKLMQRCEVVFVVTIIYSVFFCLCEPGHINTVCLKGKDEI